MNETPDSAAELLPAAAVRQLLGGVSGMTIARWQRDPKIRFPQPDFRIARRVFWKRSTIEAWLESRRHADAPAPATPGQPRPSAPKSSAAA